MSNQFPALFQPLKLATDASQPHCLRRAHCQHVGDGLPGERHRGYYEERAAGGAAMIVVEPVPVHRTGGSHARQFPPFDR